MTTKFDTGGSGIYFYQRALGRPIVRSNLSACSLPFAQRYVNISLLSFIHRSSCRSDLFRVRHHGYSRGVKVLIRANRRRPATLRHAVTTTARLPCKRAGRARRLSDGEWWMRNRIHLFCFGPGGGAGPGYSSLFIIIRKGVFDSS